MYRACAYYCVKNNIEITEENLKREIDNINMEIRYVNGSQVIILNGEDVTKFLRTKEVNDTVSEVSVIGIVREKMVEIQRKLSEKENVIMDGRDIGTVVFPNAEIKLFLETDIEERVRRRMLEYKEKGVEMSEQDIRENMLKRDHIDSTREIAPLKKAEDAIEIDTTKFTIDEVANKILELVKDREN